MENDINKAPNGFFENWINLKKMPYREVIEKFVKKSNEQKVLLAYQFEVESFPKSTQKDLTISDENLFFFDLGDVFKDSKWWEKVSVVDAMLYFLSVAKLRIPYFTKNYQSFPKKLTQKQKNEMFSLYQICTVYISWNAMREKKLRKIMGIKKGIFLT
jgi:hypothetical protein